MRKCVDCKKKIFLKSETGGFGRCVECYNVVKASGDYTLMRAKKRGLDSKISAFDFSLHWAPGISFYDFKAEILAIFLDKLKGNRSDAAAALGLSVRTIRNWVNEKE